MRCTARSKKTLRAGLTGVDALWGNPAVPRFTVCRFHGVGRPTGPAAANFKHGRHSKHLPRVLGSAFREAAVDPDLLSLRGEVALCEAGIVQLLERFSSGEGGELWRMVREAWAGLVAARDAGDGAALAAGMGEVERLIRSGSDAEVVWKDLYQAIDAKAKVSAREWKRQADLKRVMKGEQADGLIAALAHSVRQHVRDPEALAVISADLRRLMAAGRQAARA